MELLSTSRKQSGNKPLSRPPLIVSELEPTEEELASRKLLLEKMMTSEYDRDWLFIVKRLFNTYNLSEKQMILHLNDMVLFDESSKLHQIITMNQKPFIASIKQMDSPTMAQVGKLFNAKAVSSRFLDLDEESTEDRDQVSQLHTNSGSIDKMTSKILKDKKTTFDLTTDNKNSRDLRERDRNNWKLYELRIGDSNLKSTRIQENVV